VRAGALPGGNDRAPGTGGRVVYAETKRRLPVPFDMELRRLTEETAVAFGALFVAGLTPEAVYRADRCRSCSLLELCRPKTCGKSALRFRASAIAAALGDDDGRASP